MATIGIDVIEEPVAVLAEYGGISIAFEVSEISDVVAEADGGVRLEARRVPVPYVKDYDAIGDNPMRWAERFDLSNGDSSRRSQPLHGACDVYGPRPERP